MREILRSDIYWSDRSQVATASKTPATEPQPRQVGVLRCKCQWHAQLASIRQGQEFGFQAAVWRQVPSSVLSVAKAPVCGHDCSGVSALFMTHTRFYPNHQGPIPAFNLPEDEV